MEDKNFLVAIALCIGVYAIWFGLVQPRVSPPPPGIQSQGAAPSPTASGLASSENGAKAPAEEGTAAQSPAVRKNIPKELELHSADAEIKISPLGAAISNYRYHGPLGFVELVVDPSPGIFSTWPNAVFSAVSSNNYLTADENYSKYLKGSRTASIPPAEMKPLPAMAVLEAKLPSGLVITKQFEFGYPQWTEVAGSRAQGGSRSREPHPLGAMRLTILNSGKSAVSLPSWDLKLGPGLGTVASEQSDNAKIWRAIGLFPPPEGRTQNVLEHLKVGDHPGPWRWLAIDNRYFLAAAFPSSQDFDRVQVDAFQVEGKTAPGLRIWAKPVSLAPGETKAYDIPFYIGPKGYTKLEHLNLGLERSVSFGWFDTLGRGMLRLLQYLYRVTGNYGWSIILLTIMIQMILFPLTFKSLRSMAKMRKLQPEIARLQQKFKEDPKRLNMEMMELYKAKGVNPLGGCLPMLIQMPAFYALFYALRNAWELHGAPWILWVHDLSAKDPFYILPLIMGGVMFAQNSLNPAASADPTQAAMMKWMPLIFVVMFFKFPAGLVLYWMTNSLLSTMQQLALREQLKAEDRFGG